LNHPKVMKAEPSWLIPEKLAAILELLSVGLNVLKYDQELSKDRNYFRILQHSHLYFSTSNLQQMPYSREAWE